MKTGQVVGAIVAFLLLCLVLMYAFGSWGTVPAGYVGVVLKMGAVTGEIKPAGFYTKTPWVMHVIPMDVRIQKEQVDTECSSSDLQEVQATITLNLSLQSSHAANVYQTIGPSYLDTVVAPAMQESVKATMAEYTAEQLITDREKVRSGIEDLLSRKLTPVGIKVEAVSIVNFSFSSVFNQAIEAKVTAEQNALAAKNKLAQVQYEAEQSVARADGEAKAIAIQAKAIQAQGGAAYIQLMAIQKWNGVLPQFVGTGAIPFIDSAIGK
ncbi:MAG: prohibitin family protein [Verrucomicrobia bacterium]|nr:prohibitin family protein [Verrucomicrobiota bacterium]MDE3099733.1 prohibitin family protein [Verrucomicrobiota bacterium]